jgi:hypothetical protein
MAQQAKLEAVAERRRHKRHPLDGTAHLVLMDGRHLHVRVIDLSAKGAKVTRPKDQVVVEGQPLTLAGAGMPWERRAEVVLVSEAAVHLRFV